MSGRARRTAAWALLGLLTACSDLPQTAGQRPEQWQGTLDAAHAAVNGARTLSELARLAGGDPTCLALSADSQLCSWEVSNRMLGHRPLSRITNSDRRAFLLCEVPTSGTEREEGSCTVNWHSELARVRTPRPTVDSARNLLELSRFACEVPKCLASSPAVQVCEWELGNHHPGYADVKRMARSGGWIVLQCSLPADGSPREEGSCLAKRR